MPDDTDDNRPVTRSELREELGALREELREELDARFAAQDQRIDAKLDARFAAQDQRIDAKLDAMSDRLSSELAQHTRAAEENTRSMIRAMEDQYRDLPARVTRLEETVFGSNPPASGVSGGRRRTSRRRRARR